MVPDLATGWRSLSSRPPGRGPRLAG
jgi:hypothetical protein